MEDRLVGIDWRQVHARLEETQRRLAATTSLPPDTVKRILKGRAEALAKPLEDHQAAAAEMLDLLVFSVAGERYAVEMVHVQEVVVLRGLTPVPRTPPFIRGVVNLRGRILPILDLRRLLNLGGGEIPNDALAVAVEAAGMTFGLHADTVIGTGRVAPPEAGPPSPAVDGRDAALIRGVTADMITVLDLDAVAGDPRILIDEEAG